MVGDSLFGHQQDLGPGSPRPHWRSCGRRGGTGRQLHRGNGLPDQRPIGHSRPRYGGHLGDGKHLRIRLWLALAHLGADHSYELRVRAYAHIQDLEMAWFGDQSRGELMSILNDDINQLERFLDEGANDLLQVLTVVTVGGAFFLISRSGHLGGPAHSRRGLGLLSLSISYCPPLLRCASKVGELNAILNNNLTGIETIKSFTTETREVDRVERASSAYRESNRHAIRLSAAFSPLIRMAIVVGFTATLLVGGWQTLDGHLAVGAYSVLIFMTQRLLWPLTRLGRTFDLYQRAMASTKRVLDLLDTRVQVVDGPEGLAKGVEGRITFQDIHFSYANREPVLQDFSLQIDAGQTVALVGPTGSGKTTVIRLLLRFHEAEKGTITLDGMALDQLQLTALRRQVAMVSQHPVLFPGTVRDNIAYARPHASQQDIEAAAKTAEAHAFIAALPMGTKPV